jgi:hypothetical protein
LRLPWQVCLCLWLYLYLYLLLPASIVQCFWKYEVIPAIVFTTLQNSFLSTPKFCNARSPAIPARTRTVAFVVASD